MAKTRRRPRRRRRKAKKHISKALRKEIVRIVNGDKEMKVVAGTASVSAGQIGQTWSSPFRLNPEVIRGDDTYNREGNIIRPKTLTLRFYFNNTNTSKPTWNAVRMLIFRWNIRSSLAIPAPTVMLQTTSTNTGDQYTSNVQRRRQFTVLFDQIVNFGSRDGAESATRGSAKYLNLRFNLSRYTIAYDTNSDSNAKGHIYALFCNAADTTIDATTSVSWTNHMTFTE